MNNLATATLALTDSLLFRWLLLLALTCAGIYATARLLFALNDRCIRRHVQAAFSEPTYDNDDALAEIDHMTRGA